MQAAAEVTTALGLPGMSAEAVTNCRDKRRTRQMLASAGIRQPASVAVTSAADARDVAARIGLPVVVKPSCLAASQGVSLAVTLDEVGHAYAAALPTAATGLDPAGQQVLVEEHLDREEVSIDGLVAKGRYTSIFLARKQLSPEPFFEETGHVVHAADPLLHDRDLHDMLASAHTALGIKSGITHTEVRLTSRGPTIVEVNARFGGDLISYLGSLATGIDPGGAGARIAVGDTPNLSPSRAAAAAISFLYPPVDCRVRAVVLPAPDPGIGLHAAVPNVGPGYVLRLPPRGYLARYAHLIATGPTPDHCLRVLCDVKKQVALAYDEIADEDPTPAGPPPPSGTKGRWNSRGFAPPHGRDRRVEFVHGTRGE